MNDNIKRLYRTEGPDARLAGVCGGLAEFFGIDPTIVRVTTAVITPPMSTPFTPPPTGVTGVDWTGRRWCWACPSTPGRGASATPSW